MSNALAYMLGREVNYRVMKHKWTTTPGRYIFPVTIWKLSDYANHGKWSYESK